MMKKEKGWIEVYRWKGSEVKWIVELNANTISD